MSDTPPTLQQPLPESGKSRLTTAHYILLLVSFVFMAVCASMDWSRAVKRTSDLPPSSTLFSYRLGSAATNFIVPGVIAIIVAAVSRRNNARRFVLTLFWSCCVIAFAHLGQLTMPPPKPRLLQPITHMAGATLVTNDSPRFSIEIPEGFKSDITIKRKSTVTHVFSGVAAGDPEQRVVIVINKLGGLLPRRTEQNQKRLKDSLPPNSELLTNNWRGLTIDSCITRIETNGASFSICRIRVPLKPRAIEIELHGMAESENGLKALAESLVASLDGPTNW
jgi:hypothetical protein